MFKNDDECSISPLFVEMQHNPHTFTCFVHMLHIIFCTDLPHLPKASLCCFSLHLGDAFLPVFKDHFLILFILQLIKFIKGQSLQLMAIYTITGILCCS